MKADSRKQKAESGNHFHHAPRAGFGFLLSAFCFQISTLAQPTNDIPQLAPPYAELPPTFWEQHGVAVILGGVVFFGLIVFGLWLVLRPKPVPPVPPEVQARQALAALQARPEDGVLLSDVSQVLRRYLVAVFALPAAESTTTEFCRMIGNSESVGAELSAVAAEFLRDCDVRKFSPAGAGPPLNAVARALELVERAEARKAQLAAAQNQSPA